ncbi:glycosyl hydrolase family 18 protein [Thalassotalea sp. SU-HH00458]|uniref:glycosyl hydrolase family 18 protein n=1 Tax=Thalassotalea sp. SU-HH00458 TaxID=3127657 RepID=UPI003107534E
MNKRLLTMMAISTAVMSWQSIAAPSTPSINWEPQEYSFVEVDLEGNGSYKDIVTVHDEVNINIEWNAWSGDGGDNYKVYFDQQLVNSGTLPTGTKSGVINFPYQQSGRHTLYVELCEGTSCARSDGKPIVIADTDGGHLAPLPMDYDPNNGDYGTKQDLVTGAYFVEWGIYGRDFDVTNIPAHNLSHILYGFIPICGPNESLKEIENGGSHNALVKACGGSNDFEVVIHDPWAAIQKTLPGVDSSDPIRGTYAQMMALKQRYPDLKILPSIGGWTLSDPFFYFTDKANRDTFVASVKTFLTTWKFYDGVDIDWEYPGGDGASTTLGDPAQDGAAYVALMAELRAMLDELESDTGREYQLTSAIGVGYDKIEDVDYGNAAQHMDYIFAMSYDFYGAWNNVTGHQTGIYCGSHLSADECNGTGLDDEGEPRKGPSYTIDNALNLLLAQGVPSKQIVVGTAMYGRGWEGVLDSNADISGNPMTAPGNGKLTGTSAEGVWEAGVIDYKGIKANMIGTAETGINGFEIGYDEAAEAAYVWNRANGKLITYDSPRSVIAKGQYVKTHDLGGLFAWEIDADNGDILNAMHQGLDDGTPPTNKKPVVSVTNLVSVNSGESTSITATATDADNDPLSYSWTADSALTLSGSNTETVSITAPNVSQDTDYTAIINVSDGTDTVSKSVVVRVIAPSSSNNAPVVDPIDDLTVDEGVSVNITVTASDADNDPLSYQWTVPAGITLTGSGESITLQAGEVSTTTTYIITVSVSDGTEQSSTSFNLTVNDTNVTNPSDTWDPSAVYTADDIVIYQGIEYRAKWWTQGDQPDLGGPWEAVNPDTSTGDWNPNAIYHGGDQVIHNGDTYTAQWWTQGEEPGVSAVWVKQ